MSSTYAREAFENPVPPRKKNFDEEAGEGFAVAFPSQVYSIRLAKFKGTIRTSFKILEAARHWERNLVRKNVQSFRWQRFKCCSVERASERATGTLIRRASGRLAGCFYLRNTTSPTRSRKIHICHPTYIDAAAPYMQWPYQLKGSPQTFHLFIGSSCFPLSKNSRGMTTHTPRPVVFVK